MIVMHRTLSEAQKAKEECCVPNSIFSSLVGARVVTMVQRQENSCIAFYVEGLLTAIGGRTKAVSATSLGLEICAFIGQ